MAAARLFIPVALVFLGVVTSISPFSISDMVEKFMGPVEQEPMMMENRIVGGHNASIEDYPHQVSFTVNNSYFCGGFIISESYIITAAHCSQNVDPSTVVLRAGSSWRTNGTIIPVANVTAHPDYDNPPFDNDVGVIRTVEPIKFTESIKPISLPPKGRQMIAYSKFSVSGWGKTKFGANTIPERLMAVEISVIEHKLCRFSYPNVLTDNEFCGGRFIFGGKGTCQGDSGGAATQDGYAVGIVSYGRGCGDFLLPSVFADIASPDIRDFICENTGIC